MNRNRITALLLSLALLLTCLCPLGLAESTEDPVLATVNGRQVLKSEVDYYVNEIVNQYAQNGYDLSDEESLKFIRPWAMTEVLFRAFLDEKTKELGADQLSSEEIELLNNQVDETYNSFLDYIQAQTGLTPPENATEEEIATARKNAEDIAASIGSDKAAILSYLTEQLIYNKVSEQLAQDNPITDEDIVEAYQQQLAKDTELYADDPYTYEMNVLRYSVFSVYTPEGFRGIRHILLKADDELLTKYQDLLARFEEQQNAAETEAPAEAAKTEAPAEAAVTEAPAEAAETEAPAEAAVTEAPAEVAETEAPAEAAETEAAAETAVTEAPAEAAETEAAAETAVTEAPAATEEPVLEPVTQEEVDAAREAVLASVQDTIDEIMTKYESGTPFADLIAEYGTDPGMEAEPDKTNGYSVYPDSVIYVPAFVEAAFSVDHIGDISKPYVSEFGVHIIEYTRDVPAGAVELTDDVKATIREQLEDNLYESVVNEAFEEWLTTADIQYTEAGTEYQPSDSLDDIMEIDEDDEAPDDDDDDDK